MRDAAEDIRRICSFPQRGPCTDSERQAARTIAMELLAMGRPARIEPVWTWPGWPLPWALLAAAGVIASVIAPGTPEAGLALASGALVLGVLDLAGIRVIRMLAPRRASQNVVSIDSGPPAEVRLLLTAHVDAGGSGHAYGRRAQRLQGLLLRASAGLAPGGLGWVVAALALIALTAGARMAGSDGTAVAVAALLPTLGLIAAAALLLDAALSLPGPGAGEAAAAAALLAVLEELEREPPRALAVDAVFSGAGTAGHLGWKAHLRSRRRELRPAETAVIELRACAAGEPRAWVRDGRLLPARMHPRLVEIAGDVAASEADLGAQLVIGRGDSAALAARRRRLPALALGALAPDGTVPRLRQASDVPSAADPQAVRRVVEYALAVIDELDAELASAPEGS